MATRYWLGRATAVAQTATVQITGNDAATTYKLTVGGVTVSVTGQGSASLTAAALATAWNASTHPYFAAVTAADNSDTITLTADTAGVPFVATSSATGGGGTMGSVTAGTANAGPNEFTTAANWSAETVPTDGDRAVFADTDVSLYWGTDQSANAIEIHVMRSFTGHIGLNPAKFRTSSTTEVTTADEYRQSYLKVNGGTVYIGLESGSSTTSGSGRIKIDTHTAAATINVYSTASSSADGAGTEPVRLLCASASTVLNVLSGIVGLATDQEGAETSTIATINGTGEGSTSAPTVNIGVGVTATTINCSGNAKVNNQGCAATTVNCRGDGNYTCVGTGAHTTVNCFDGGKVFYRSSGTITNLDTSSVVDFRGDPRAKTVSNCVARRGADINANTGVPLSVTFSTGVDVEGCTLADVKLNFGSHFTVTPSAI